MSTITDESSTLEREQPAMTIGEFCALEHMSTSTYRKLRKQGLGPEETAITLPGTRFVRITSRARLEWHLKLQELQRSKAVKLERARRTAQAVAKGKLSATSPAHISHRRAAR